MAGLSNSIQVMVGAVAVALILGTACSASETDDKSFGDNKPAPLQNASYNGMTCDHVRAKVAESGVTAAYAYARYMGMSSRDIAKVRKACSV